MMRKNFGLVVGGLTVLSLLAYKPWRVAYGPISFFLQTAFASYQTGVRNLWGCVLNLKTNFDGKGFKEPSKNNIEFVKSKRNEMIFMSIGTHILMIAITLAVARYMNHGQKQVTMSVLKWQLGGFLLFMGLSLAAKWLINLLFQVILEL